MIKEAYCSFEVSKMLKEKGFDESCLHYYWTEIVLGKECINFSFTDEYFHNSEVEYGAYKGCKCTAPTQQMAMAWLRELHNIHISVEPDWVSKEGFRVIGYVFNIYSYTNPWYDHCTTYNTYEEAVEAAIKYCLELLI